MFTLPIRIVEAWGDFAAGEADANVSEALAARGERVAVVDDESAMVTVTEKILQKMGYATASYLSGPRFLKAFEMNPDRFDLVVIDLVMPGMSGSQLIRKLREDGHDVPVLLTTGFELQARPEWSAAGGRTSFLRKPYSAAQLGQSVRRLLHAQR